jgi:hypothetical protein
MLLCRLKVQNIRQHAGKGIGHLGFELFLADVTLAKFGSDVFSRQELVHPFVNRVPDEQVVDVARGRL